MRWHGRRVTVYAYAQPTDMRKGFDGLGALVTQGLQRDPLFCGGPRSVTRTLQKRATPQEIAAIKRPKRHI